METQSPINLTATHRATSLLPLKVNWSGTSGFIHHGDHGIQVIFPQPNDNSVTLEGKQFILQQFHFHHPSEHFLNKQQFDGELHIVHQDLNDCTFCVIGVFLSVSEQTDTALTAKTFFDALQQKRADIPTDPGDWLPKGVDRALRYEGSLTTPPYSETVSWVVLHDPLVISHQQFGAIFGDGTAHARGSSKPQKARPLQPVNRRYIVEQKVKW